MVDISTIVQVTITKETQSISQQGFGVPLILGPNGPNAARVTEEYASLSEVAVDFATTDDEYLAANAIFAQSPRVEKIKIVKNSTKVPQQISLVFSADIITGNSIALKVDDVSLTATPFNATNGQTLTDLAAKIQATDGVATAVSDGVHTILCTAATAGLPFTLTDCLVTGGLTQATAVITTTVDNLGLVEDLNAIVLEDNDWYGLITTSRTEAEVLLVAAWVEANYKLYFTCTEAAGTYNPASTTDLAYLLQDANYERTVVVFNEDEDDWIDAGWMGVGLAYTPGSITWKFKEVVGPSASPLTSAQRTAVLNKNCNVYTEIAGVDMMEDGTTASGEFIDIIHGIDWLRARMAEGVFSKLVNAKKIPYTDAGVAIIQAEIMAVLENAIKIGLIARAPDEFDGKDYIVSVPKVVDVSDNDKANRLLPDVTWQAVLAGAIHKVIIEGRVQI